MRSKNSKNKNNREKKLYVLEQMYNDLNRLKSEMSIMYFLHKDEISNMNLVHENMKTEIEKKMIEEQLEKTINGFTNEDKTNS